MIMMMIIMMIMVVMMMMMMMTRRARGVPRERVLRTSVDDNDDNDIYLNTLNEKDITTRG
jgi:flagellar biosynthesis/type III secretory pathway M-ring protein FliF/YscJ